MKNVIIFVLFTVSLAWADDSSQILKRAPLEVLQSGDKIHFTLDRLKNLESGEFETLVEQTATLIIEEDRLLAQIDDERYFIMLKVSKRKETVTFLTWAKYQYTTCPTEMINLSQYNLEPPTTQSPFEVGESVVTASYFKYYGSDLRSHKEDINENIWARNADSQLMYAKVVIPRGSLGTITKVEKKYPRLDILKSRYIVTVNFSDEKVECQNVKLQGSYDDANDPLGPVLHDVQRYRE